MAIKFATSSLSSSESNISTIEKFTGVDYTTTSTQVDDSRAIDISNYLPNGNSLYKRNGAEVKTYLNKDNINYFIHNIWKCPIKDYTGKDKYYVFVTEKDEIGHKNPMILTVSDLFDLNERFIHHFREFKTYDYKYPPYIELKDLYSYGVEFDCKLFILCMGEYLFTNTTEYGDSLIVDLERVVDYAYVPTVVVGLGDETKGAKNSQHEDFNLLSNKCYIELLKYDTGVLYKLKGFFPENASIKILKINDIEVGDKLDWVNDIAKSMYINGLGTFSLNPNTYELGYVPKKEDDETHEYEDMYIKLEIQFDTGVDRAKIVENMRFGVPYGSYGYRDRLFLAGNPDYPNMDIHSCDTEEVGASWKDYTYFGDNSYTAIGTSDTAILGYGFLNNGQMTIIKESKTNEPSIFIRGCTVSKDTSNDLFSDYNYSEVFTITNTGLNMCVDYGASLIHYGNDILANTKRGIYKLFAGESTATQTYNIQEMSYFIRDNLGDRIDNSSFVVFEDKLYLLREDFKGNKRVYVADSNKYSYMDGKQIYEWYVLDFDFEVDKLFIIDKCLYFSSNNKLFTFTKRYTDLDLIRTLDVNINGRDYSKEVFVKEIDEAKNRIIINEQSEFIEGIKNNVSWDSLKTNVSVSVSNSIIVHKENQIPTDVDIHESHITLEIPAYTEEDLMFPIIIANLLRNTADKDWEYKPHFIHGGIAYFCSNIEMTENGYILYGSVNSEEDPFDDMKDLKYVSLLLNCNKQNFKLEVSELYYNDYPFSKCVLYDNEWYYKDNDEVTYLGLTDYVSFNEFTVKLYGYEIDFSFPFSIRTVDIFVQEIVKSYWHSKFTSMGRVDYLKTIEGFVFVCDSKKSGETDVKIRTMKKNSWTPTTHAYKDFDFNDVDFNEFSFSSNDMAKTQTFKKKIKNFSFVQFSFESDKDTNSTVVSLTVKYKYTKTNKGVR